MKSMITAKERKLLIQYKREWDELGRYLHSATVDAETASPEVWRRYFEGCLKLSATPYPGMELAAHILARDYLMKKHGVKTFDLSGRFKPKSNISYRDRCGIKAKSASGEKIAAIILSGDYERLHLGGAPIPQALSSLQVCVLGPAKNLSQK